MVVQGSLPDKLKSRSLVIPNPVRQTRPNMADIHQAKRIIMERVDEGADISKLVIIGFFGTLRDLKRPMVFVDALATLTEWGEKNVVGLMFGKDLENLSTKILEHASERGVANQIVLMGFHSTIDRFMSACDVVVSTSVGDAFGRTLIEGMALGVPVVAVNAGGHPEVIRDGIDGILTEPDEPESVAHAICAVVGDRRFRDRLITAGRQSARTRFSIEEHTFRMTKLYHALAQDQNSVSR